MTDVKTVDKPKVSIKKFSKNQLKKEIEFEPKLKTQQDENVNEAQKILVKLRQLSEDNQLPPEILVEVFLRGVDTWEEESNHTCEQHGFHRVHSFLNGGLARRLDEDLLENKETYVRHTQFKGAIGAAARHVFGDGLAARYVSDKEHEHHQKTHLAAKDIHDDAEKAKRDTESETKRQQKRSERNNDYTDRRKQAADVAKNLATHRAGLNVRAAHDRNVSSIHAAGAKARERYKARDEDKDKKEKERAEKAANSPKNEAPKQEAPKTEAKPANDPKPASPLRAKIPKPTSPKQEAPKTEAKPASPKQETTPVAPKQEAKVKKEKQPKAETTEKPVDAQVQSVEPIETKKPKVAHDKTAGVPKNPLRKKVPKKVQTPPTDDDIEGNT